MKRIAVYGERDADGHVEPVQIVCSGHISIREFNRRYKQIAKADRVLKSEIRYDTMYEGIRKVKVTVLEV